MRARKASIWFRQQGAFAIAIPGDEDDGGYLRLKIGRREFQSEPRFVRRRDAGKTARAVWAMLFGEDWGT